MKRTTIYSIIFALIVSFCFYQEGELRGEPRYLDSSTEDIEFKIDLRLRPEFAIKRMIKRMTEEQKNRTLKGFVDNLFGPIIESTKIYIRTTRRFDEKVERERAKRETIAAEQQRLAEENAAMWKRFAEEAAASKKRLAEEEKQLWQKRKKNYPHWPDKVWNAIKSHQVFLGMTKEQAKMSWGYPEDINTTITMHGTYEQWVYDIYAHRYLYFDNGILTTIQK